jgi:hypothetical protein
MKPANTANTAAVRPDEGIEMRERNPGTSALHHVIMNSTNSDHEPSRNVEDMGN